MHNLYQIIKDMKNILLIILILLVTQYSGYSQMVWTVYDTSNSILPNMVVGNVCEGQNGVIWVSTWNGLVEIDGTNWIFYDSSSTGHVLNNIFSMTYDKHNNMLWLSNPYNLFRFDGTTWMQWNYSVLVGNSFDIAIQSDGTVWQAHYNWPGPGGISSFNGVSFTYYDTFNSPMPSNFVYSIDVSSNDDVWITTDSSGLVKLSGGSNWTVFNTSNSGIPSNYVRCTAIDSSGLVWVYGYNDQETSGYLASFDGISWSGVDTNVCTVPVTGQGDIAIDQYNQKWFGTFGEGLNVYSDTTCIYYTTGNSPLPLNALTDVLIASNGTVWAGTFGGGLVRIDMPVGVEELNTDNNFKVFPNPSRGEIHLEFPFIMNASFQLLDPRGVVVFESDVTGNLAKYPLVLPLDITNGLYICRVVSEKFVHSEKFILVR
jgi:ligand-binding sensor domain-containing protein